MAYIEKGPWEKKRRKDDPVTKLSAERKWQEQSATEQAAPTVYQERKWQERKKTFTPNSDMRRSLP